MITRAIVVILSLFICNLDISYEQNLTNNTSEANKTIPITTINGTVLTSIQPNVTVVSSTIPASNETAPINSTTTINATTTTINATTTTLNATTTILNTNTTTTTSHSSSTTTQSTTTKKNDETTTKQLPPKPRGFDGSSFVGGIVLCAGIFAIAFFTYKFCHARNERDYHQV